MKCPILTDEYIFQQRKAIGAELRSVREARGLTQEQLGDLLGISKDHVSRVESGHWNFGINTLTSFLTVLEHELKIIPKKD